MPPPITWCGVFAFACLCVFVCVCVFGGGMRARALVLSTYLLLVRKMHCLPAPLISWAMALRILCVDVNTGPVCVCVNA